MGAKWSEPSVRDEDRLPWLESADEEFGGGAAWQKIAALVAVGLLVIAAAVFGISWYKNRAEPAGSGELIAAPAGDYKVKPDQPGGMKVDGEGTAALATSQGKADGGGSIDLNGAPETPIVGQRAGPGTAPRVASGAGMAVPASGGRLTATKPGAPAVRSGASGGSLVQLGAFPSEGEANAEWATMSRRFGYLAPLGKSVEKAEVNGRAVYRLRVNTGSAGAAQTLCGKLKIAGEACFIPN